MPDLPPQAVTAAAVAIERELMSGDHYAGSAESDEALARAALEAAAPILAEHAAQRILEYMEAHAPSSPGSWRARGSWRRHLQIAARVAGRAFSSDDDLRRAAAEVLGRACRKETAT